MRFLKRFILHEQPAVTLRLNRQTLSLLLDKIYSTRDLKTNFMLSHDLRFELSLKLESQTRLDVSCISWEYKYPSSNCKSNIFGNIRVNMFVVGSCDTISHPLPAGTSHTLVLRYSTDRPGSSGLRHRLSVPKRKSSAFVTTTTQKTVCPPQKTQLAKRSNGLRSVRVDNCEVYILSVQWLWSC